MSGFDRLNDLLPTLWRPEPDDRTLVAEWLRAVGASLDQAAAQTQEVLRAHWSDTADAALWAPHYQAERRERGLPAANVRLPADWAELQRYPYLCDTARLASLLDLSPWRDPASLRENVEEYRLRVQDIVAAYTDGLVTVEALRRLVEAALPEDMEAPLARRRAGFAIEEPVALRSLAQALVVPGAHEGDLVAPLSRWSLPDAATAPTVIMQGLAASDSVAATTDPVFERYTPNALPVGLGLAWQGTLAEGEALRFAPARSTWSLRGGVLQVSALEAAQNVDGDPSANGPWGASAAPAAGEARTVLVGPDGVLWLITVAAEVWAVQRFDGNAYTSLDTNAPVGPFHALLTVGDSLFLAADQGLFRAPLWPESGPAAWTAVPDVTGAVRALVAMPEGLAAAGADGVWYCAADGAVLVHSLPGLDLYALAIAGDQAWAATEGALFLFQQEVSFRYDGSGLSETIADWLPVDAPDSTLRSPLPAVKALARMPDGSLWIATADGLARWRVRDAHTTLLEAFPDVLLGPVNSLHVDERGMLWIAADAGLFRFDGAFVAQYDFTASAWVSLGFADTVYPDDISEASRGHWRYDALSSTWQQWTGSRFAGPGLASRALPSDAVQAALTAPSVRAERGTWDGSQFSASAAVPASELLMRIKPSDTRIVNGGAPFLPAPLPAPLPGARWRYLQLDLAPTPPANGPWWSREGQLFPPPVREAPLPGHFRTPAAWNDDGQFDNAVFIYAPSARLWVSHALLPAIGVRIRLFQNPPDAPVEPALVERVWALVGRARAAGVPLQLLVEGRIVKETVT